MDTKKPIYRRKRYQTPIIIIAVLIVIRLFLPRIVKGYVNDVLADIPGYYGQVEDIDLAIYRGAYVIKGMYLNKVNAKTQLPFIKLPQADISVEWKSLFRGKIVSEIHLLDPEITYVFEDQAEADSSEADDWTDALNDLVPLDINKLQIKNGKFSFVQVSADPDVDLSIYNADLVADNLRIVKSKVGTLPSTIHGTARSFGDGYVKIDGQVNIIKEVPDVDVSFELKEANATALNGFTQHYGRVDFEKGNFSVFGEIAIADKYMKGYVKPLLSDSKLIGKSDTFPETLWEGFIGVFKFVLKNQKTNTLGTKVPFEGSLENVNTGVWTSVKNIFINAWIKALKGEVDNDIDYKDAEKIKNKKEEKAEKEKKRDKKD